MLLALPPPACRTRPAAPPKGELGREGAGEGEREGVPKASQMHRVSWQEKHNELGDPTKKPHGICENSWMVDRTDRLMEIQNSDVVVVAFLPQFSCVHVDLFDQRLLLVFVVVLPFLSLGTNPNILQRRHAVGQWV